MSWLQLQLVADTNNAKTFEALLEAAGALAVTMIDAADQPLFEPSPGETPLWNNILVTGLFAESSDATEIIKQLTENFQNKPLPQIKTQVLADKNWPRVWMDSFEPMRFGERLWICPSGCDAPNPKAINILLDPGLAFGTGTHPTTALCLQWLDSQDLTGQALIDYGCGSGILGIGALLLNAKIVYGVDNDPQALTATEDNCIKNSLNLERFPSYLPRTFAKKITQQTITKADGVLANILAGSLVELSEYLSALVKPEGWILLSGILEEQADSVIAAYQQWFENIEVGTQNGWVRITGIKKSFSSSNECLGACRRIVTVARESRN